MSGDTFEQMWSLEQKEITRHYDGMTPGDARRMRDASEQVIGVLRTIATDTTDDQYRSSAMLCAHILEGAYPGELPEHSNNDMNIPE